MCGICGIFSLKISVIDSDPVIRKMTHALSHRGPDAEAFFQNTHCLLGHRRLEVIDLEGGKQPMMSQDGTVCLVFNGEIYNFMEIRRELEKKGHLFRTRSDTESLLKLYEEQGIDCIRQLEGMFAFAIFDQTQMKLYLGTDRFGKKPLYYSFIDQICLFSSELKSLLLHPLIQKQIDPVSLAQYLAFEYVPAPRSLIENVRKLEMGTFLEASEEGIRVDSYHAYDYSHLVRSEADWMNDLSDNFRQSVRKRLISDVPLGVFLSGGLDSSSVLAMVKELEPLRKIKTFSIQFTDPSFDESKYARKVSDFFETEHITEECSAARMLNELEKILDWVDEPLSDASFIPTFMLCRLARRHVTVALSGDGGDELFGGYPTFYAYKIAQRLAFLPKEIIRCLQKLANTMPVSMNNISLDFQVKQFLKGMAYKGPIRNQVWLGAFCDTEVQKVLAGAYLPGDYGMIYAPINKHHRGDLADPLDQLQEQYFRFYLQGDILVKVDRASMANSLEVRSPFLDDDLVQNVLKMPFEFKMRGRMSKYILKKVMRGRLPDDIIFRQKKGFGIPIAKWICQDLRREFQEILNPQRMAKDGIFNAHEVQTILNDHLAGKKDNRKKLWTLYVFQKWKQRVLG